MKHHVLKETFYDGKCIFVLYINSLASSTWLPCRNYFRVTGWRSLFLFTQSSYSFDVLQHIKPILYFEHGFSCLSEDNISGSSYSIFPEVLGQFLKENHTYFPLYLLSIIIFYSLYSI